ncbi:MULTISPECIES: hypothetical protein [unclassified Shewanella]|uniref:hypothetical protein n=2 Tax=unclassified Shewanella TaxID=196818 RepID=UPI002005AFF9|nr:MULTISPECIES: hypothetical protein [unclassified Shewanella]MCK7634876.1 hypothetical protein [Shewanella sp. JNE17]MCK7650101.1 hypothetical protein [Shewanella sp. JNE8]MCK7658230.1 hypothetical protein [Shewanella sp. JNE4-2]UPO31395.1 hypothetical protein MZ182_00610 [Shewanella sp. JNE2]
MKFYNGTILLVLITFLLSSCSNIGSSLCQNTNAFPAALKDDIDHIIDHEEEGWKTIHNRDPDILQTAQKAQAILSNNSYCIQSSLNNRPRGYLNTEHKDKSNGRTGKQYLEWFVENAPQIYERKNLVLTKERDRREATAIAEMEKREKLRDNFIKNGYTGLDLQSDLDAVVIDLMNGSRNIANTKNIVFRANFSGYKVTQVLKDTLLLAHVYTGSIIAIRMHPKDPEYTDGMRLHHDYISLLGTYSYRTVMGAAKKVFLFQFAYQAQ